jgi:hypothetical protein
LSLHQDLTQKIPRDQLPQLPKKKRLGVLDPSFVDERRQSLELYLQALISIREVWNCSCFTEFLDISHPFLGIHLQMTRLTDEVGRLGDENKYLVEQLGYTRAALSTSNKMMVELLRRVDTMEEVLRESLPCPCKSESLRDPLGSSHNLEIAQPSPPETADFQNTDVTPHWWSGDIQIVSKDSLRGPELFQSTAEPHVPSCQETTSVLKAIIPLQEFFHSSALSRLTNTVLNFLTPTVEQLKQRFQVEKYIAKLVRKSLGAQVYQMGLYSIRSFLPDDPVTLSIYLCRGLENSWYLRLNEKLCRMSSSIHAQRESTDSPDDSTGILNPSDSQDLPLHHPPPPTHIIKNVSFMEEHCEHRLQCAIGSYTVDIRATQKIDLCFAAFIEEFDRAVGRDHFFKKSLILIRAWWTLEASASSESALPTLSTSAICVMVCAIFNRFQGEIYHPIHSLMLFLTEYSSFDWANYGLTVYGPVARALFDSPSVPLSHQRCLELHPESLISSELIAKYEEFLQQTLSPEAEKEAGGNPSNEKSLLNELFFSLEGNPSSTESKSIAPRERYPGFIPSDCMHIFHPLCLEVNIIPASDSEHYPSLMTAVMCKGRDSILPILALAVEVESSSAELFKFSQLESTFEAFFHETYSKYSQSYQPDLHKTMSFESLLSFELDSSSHDVQKPSTLLYTPSTPDSTHEDTMNTYDCPPSSLPTRSSLLALVS